MQWYENNRVRGPRIQIVTHDGVVPMCCAYITGPPRLGYADSTFSIAFSLLTRNAI